MTPAYALLDRFRFPTRLIIGLLIGIIALWWAMRGLDLAKVFRTLSMVSLAWVSIAFICVVVVALAKAVRWGILYGATEPQTPFWDLFSVLVAAQMVNLVIPVRTGELIRIVFMKQVDRPSAITLSTIVVEKALDLVTAGLIAVSLVILAVTPDWLRESASSILLIGFILIGGLPLIWWLHDWLEQFLTRMLISMRWLPTTWHERVLGGGCNLLDAFGRLTDIRSLARVSFWTFVIWSLSLLTIFSLFIAFGLHLPIVAAGVIMLAISFSNIAPSPPALVGVIPGIAVVVLDPYNVMPTTALGFGIMLNVVTVVPLILLGGWGLWGRTVFVLEVLRKQSMNELYSG